MQLKTRGQTVKFQHVTVKGVFLKPWESRLHKCTLHQCQMKQVNSHEIQFACETAEPKDIQKLYWWMNLWSKFMFAIRREGECFSFLHERSECVRVDLHTQLDIIVYMWNCVQAGKGLLCIISVYIVWLTCSMVVGFYRRVGIMLLF